MIHTYIYRYIYNIYIYTSRGPGAVAGWSLKWFDGSSGADMTAGWGEATS